MKYCSFLIFGLIFFIAGETNCQDEQLFSSDTLFNLGNQAYSDEQFDQAIFYYEKAKLLDPTSKDIAINLQLANEQLSTDIIEIEPFFLATWWQYISGLLLPGGWKILSVVILIGLLVLVYLFLFKNKQESNNLFYSMLGILLFLFLVSLFAGVSRTNQIFESPFVIVFGDDQTLQLGPDEVSEQVKEITGGNKLKVLDQDGEWYKVSAMDSEQGWIKKERVKHIKF